MMPTIRVIELFAGIGSQAEALNRIGADWKSAGIVEIDPYCVTAYNAIHGTNYKQAGNTIVVTVLEAVFANIKGVEKFW